MGSKGKSKKRSKRHRALDKILSKIKREILRVDRVLRKKERNDRKRSSQTASEIIQRRLERMESPSSSSSSAANSDKEGERNSVSSPMKHTEETTKAATIDNNIVLSSDSDADPNELAKGLKMSNDLEHRINKSKEEMKFNDNPSTKVMSSNHHSMDNPSTSKIVNDNGSFNHHSMDNPSPSKIVNGYQINKAKKKRKNKMRRTISTVTYPNKTICDDRHSFQQLQKLKHQSRLRKCKKTRHLRNIRARTNGQFVEADEENDDSDGNNEITFLENVKEVTVSPNSSNSQNNRPEVNGEQVLESSLRSSHINHYEEDNCVSDRMQSHHFDRLVEPSTSQSVTRQKDLTFAESPNLVNLGTTSLSNGTEVNGESSPGYNHRYDENCVTDRMQPHHFDRLVEPSTSQSTTTQENVTNGNNFTDSTNLHSPRASSVNEICEKNVDEITDCSDISDGDFSPNDEFDEEHASGYDPQLQNYEHDDVNHFDANGGDDNGYGHPLDSYYHEDTRDYYDDYYEEVVIEELDDQHGQGADPSANQFYGNGYNANMPYAPIYRVDRSPISCSPNSDDVTIRHDDVADAEKSVAANSNPYTWSDSSRSPKLTAQFPNLCTDETTDTTLESTNNPFYDFIQRHTVAPPLEPIQFFTSSISNKVLLLLKTKLYFHGSLNIRLLAGQASVFGYKLQPNDKVAANSFPGHGTLCLCPEFNAENNNESLDELSEHLSDADFHKIKSEFYSATDAIVELETNSNKSIAMIEKYMDESITSGVTALSKSSQLYETESMLHCNFLQNTETGLIVGPKWEDIVMSSTSRQIIVGGKDVGKSTLLRYLVNKNLPELQKILLIDLDIDRPEVFLTKTISATVITKPLLGLGFLTDLTPVKSYLFNVTVLAAPMKYLQCVYKLLEYCRSNEELVKLPWIVNTIGYVEKIDFEVTIEIVRAVSPTELIQIQGHDAIGTNLAADFVNEHYFQFLNCKVPEQQCQYALHAIDVVFKVNSRKTSTENVQLAIILARLANKLPLNASLTKIKPPVRTSLKSLTVLVDDDPVAPHLQSNVINGNLCYLCQSLNDKFVECVGVGLVRGVDVVAENAYLLPSVDNDELETVNTLAVCGVPVSMFMLLDQLPRTSISVPYMYRNENVLK